MRAAALVLFLAGCASVPSGTAPLGVGQLLQRAPSIDGMVVNVEGVMSGCNADGCRLRDAFSGAGPTMTVGGDAAFANAMRRAGGRTVIVRGRVDASCLRGSAPPPPGTGMVACMGIGTPLKGAKVIAVR